MFKSVIQKLRNSSEYKATEYRNEIEETIAILESKSPSELVLRTGELHYKINNTIARTSARGEYYQILQNSSNFELAIKSKQLQKIAKLIGKYMKLWFIGSPFSMRKGNFIIFEGELFPFEILNMFDYPINLIPHTWRDIKAYREKGIIDIETGEGIIGTEIGNESLLIQKPWFYQLFDKKGAYELKVFCGTIAQYELSIALNQEERDKIYEEGMNYIDDLAEKIRSSPKKFEARRIK